jgi:hypothetical protein
MNAYFDLEFMYMGHRVQVSHEDVPHKWLGDFDTVFAVWIDGDKVVVPGIWQAFQVSREKGIRMVIEAFLDSSPLHVHN